ncbi:30S ribosomal protein S8 [Patescibacteria group bacterium]|jgi:small subunit ribosomal protein S8|nr:30S ribosomal protein S8 [Patescibacteria group bacterium]
MTDPVGDLINRLKNAQAVGHERAALPYSRLKEAIAQKLSERGYVGAVAKKTKKRGDVLEIELAYRDDGTPRIRGAERLSRPGRRLYRGAGEVPRVKQGLGATVVSTPKGILTDREARREGAGGELLFSIW